MTVERKASSIKYFSKWYNLYPFFVALSWLIWIPSVGMILVDWNHKIITITKTTVSTPSIIAADISSEWPLWLTAIVKPNIDKTNTAGKICVRVGDLANPLWFISILFNYVCYCDYLGPLESMLFYISNINIRKISKGSEIRYNDFYGRMMVNMR